MGGLGNLAMLTAAVLLFGLLGYPAAAASRGEGLGPCGPTSSQLCARNLTVAEHTARPTLRMWSRQS